MSKKKNKEQEELRQSAQAAGQAEKKADIESKEETPAVDKEAKEIEEKLAKLLKENEELKASVAKEKDDYVRLMADFENFRRHSAEAKLELVSSASADTIKGLLPVLDDCERAMKMLDEQNVLERSERRGARKVLTAAALTYVAALLVSLLYLLRFLIIIASVRRRKD